MVRAAGKAGVDMITDLANQIIVEGVFPAERKLNTFVDYFKGKGDSLQRRNYRDIRF